MPDKLVDAQVFAAQAAETCAAIAAQAEMDVSLCDLHGDDLTAWTAWARNVRFHADGAKCFAEQAAKRRVTVNAQVQAVNARTAVIICVKLYHDWALKHFRNN